MFRLATHVVESRPGLARARRKIFAGVLGALVLLPFGAQARADCHFLDASGQPASAGFEVVAGHEVRIRVVDGAENTRVLRHDQVLVELQAEQSGDRTDYLFAVETGRDTGVFEATVDLEALIGDVGIDPYDSVLQTAPMDNLELVYFGASPPCVATAVVVEAGIELIDERAPWLAGTGSPAEVVSDGAVRVRLRSPTSNLDAAVVESTSVTLTSAIEGDSESLTLTETGASTGLFEGVIGLATDYAQPDDGTLETEGFEVPEPLLADTVIADHGPTGAHAEAAVISSRLRFHALDNGSAEPLDSSVVLGQDLRLELDRSTWQDPFSIDTLEVLVVTQMGDQETVSVTETSADSSIFEADLTTSSAPVVIGDGVIQGAVSGRITASHSDIYLATTSTAELAFVGSRTRILRPYGAGEGEIFQAGVFEVEVLDFAAVGGVQIEVSSILAADQETVSLSQISPGRFRGTVPTALTPGRNQTGNPGDGVLTTTGDWGPPFDDTDEVIATYPWGAGSPSSDRATPVGSRSSFVDAALEPVDVYTEGPARLRVVSPAKNEQPSVAESLRVDISPEVEGSNEFEEVYLEETGPDTGIFVGEIAIDTSMAQNSYDGILQASVGDLVGFAHFEDFLSGISNGWVTIGGPIEAPRPPVALDDTASTDEDVAVLIDVLANDSDPNGDPLTVFHAESNRGQVTIEADGRLRFVPEANFHGQARVDYEIRDPSGFTAGASVDVTIASVNDPPIAEINPPFETSGPAPFSFYISGWSSHDPDGSIVDYSWDFGDGTVANGGQAFHTFQTGGSYTVTLTVTDQQGATGTDTLDFEIIREFTVLFVVAYDTNTGDLRPGDRAVADHLENEGWLVDWRASTAVQGSDAAGFDLVLISSTPSSSSIGSKFRDVAVPVVTWESFILDDMGMTGGVAHTDYGGVNGQTAVEIADATHPLAAGLSGTPTLTTQPERYTFGRPVASAIAIGRNLERVERLHVFGYEEGATMASLAAPARRVSLFLGDTTSTILTAEGWALFDAALCWAVNCEGEAIARFSASEAAAESLDWSFDGTASEGGGGAAIIDWTWDFGDGTLLSGGLGVADRPSHTYSQAGTRTVTLTVTDAAGGTDSESRTFFVGPAAMEALFVVGSTSLGAGDEAALARLQALGLGVTVIGQADAQSSDANGKDLVVISSSIQSSQVNTKFRDVAVPVVTWESYLFDDMGLTATGANVNYGLDAGQTSIEMVSSGHAIASGLSGSVAYYLLTDDLRWGIPASAATVVAVSPVDPAHAAVFVYEAGDTMVGLSAPARRVALPYSDLGPANSTSNGEALFDGAIEWALGLR